MHVYNRVILEILIFPNYSKILIEFFFKTTITFVNVDVSYICLMKTPIAVVLLTTIGNDSNYKCIPVSF